MERLFAALLFLLLLTSGELWKKADSAKITCKICKQFVTSFDKRLAATANSNYAGGDTSWEEENLGSYMDSEVRLVEVLDTVCDRSDYSCHGLLEKAEEDIERWWFKLRKLEETKDLQSWLCFTHLDACCPENTFGPNCDLCPGAPDNTCGGRGKCEGVGEKDGSGECTCDTGYTGDLCGSCDTNYYEEGSDEEEEEGEEEEEQGEQEEKVLICKKCDASCAGSCDGPGSADCHACASGYKEDDGGSCADVDECKIDGDTRCRDGTYCYNTLGSFSCHDCDKACKKICNGPGPVKCAECATGYTRNEHGVCRDDDECENGTATCRDGTYCENTPGKYDCKACHISCLFTCHGAGSKGCVACKEGYVMSVEEGCEDINECDLNPPPCDATTETCSNLMGSFTCKCQEDLVKGEDGRCVSREVRDAQRQAKKEKKKRKKKKKKRVEEEAESRGNEGEEFDDAASSEEGERKEEREGQGVPQAGQAEEGERQEVHPKVDAEDVPVMPNQESVSDTDPSAEEGSSSKEQEVGSVQEVNLEQKGVNTGQDDVRLSEGKQSDNESLELADRDVLKEAGPGVDAPPPSSSSSSDTKDEL